ASVRHQLPDHPPAPRPPHRKAQDLRQPGNRRRLRASPPGPVRRREAGPGDAENPAGGSPQGDGRVHMRAGSVVLAFLTLTSVASAADTLREFTWGQRPGVPGAEVLAPGQGAPYAQLKVDHRDRVPRTVRLLTVERPPITSPRYALVGDVRYEGVQGPAYLEMWNVFPDGSRYFSRTLGSSGPMGTLTGSSGWRPFVLPFLNRDGAPPPAALEVNLVLAGPGTVHLSPIRLVQLGPAEDPLAVQGQWWNEGQAGLVGGLLGAGLGCAGALIGWLSSKGK